MNSMRLYGSVLSVLVLVVAGCGKPTPKVRPEATGNKIAKQLAAAPVQEAPPVREATKVNGRRESPDNRKRFSEIPETESEFDFSFGGSSEDYTYSGGGTFASPGQNESRQGLSGSKIVERVTSLLKDSVDYGPTLAVWVIDESKSARELVQSIASMIQQPYSTLKPETGADKFLTAVCTFGQDVHFPVDRPSPDPSSLVGSIGTMPLDSSGKEMVFTAVGDALKKYTRYRTEDRREVMFFIVTDEAGDDQNLVASLIDEPRRFGIPIYVIGVPAPFGRAAALDASVETPPTRTRFDRAPNHATASTSSLASGAG